MVRVRIEVLNGAARGRVVEADGDTTLLGRSPSAGLMLPEVFVSGEHARILAAGEEAVLEDLSSTNGSSIVRGEARLRLGSAAPRAFLESGDIVELGGDGDEGARLAITIDDQPPAERVVALRPVAELTGHATAVEQHTDTLKLLYQLEKRIGAATELDAVLGAIADAALALLPRATHVTLVLGDEREAAEPAFAPVVTRVRGPDGSARAPDGPIPFARSVFRTVIHERAAVLAADAPSEAFSSESLLGASIRSTVGVPLLKGDQILGVIQVDNRDAPRMFDTGDVDRLGVLAANASLAVDKARLIRRLFAAEEQLSQENRYLKGRERARAGGVEIIGRSRVMRELLEQLEKVADARITVFIEGETGTGKELVASAVHFRSHRRDQLFVAQNCAALPENLLESELFGHVRGAFTGATEQRKGLFELADRGTLFLDEVTEMPLALQAKLLRALQEGEIRPVGAAHEKRVDVRIVAASNRNLEAEVKAGRFREDLYYRLKVFPLRVPPLRERRDDVALLAEHFLARYAKEFGKPVAGFTQAATEALATYDWPGNVRELENEVQRAVIGVEPGGFIEAETLSPRLRTTEGLVGRAGVVRGTLKEMVEQVERHLLIEALREHGNNKTLTAKTLGITREGLHKKLRQLKLG
ncbi:MAG: sigma 54-interacting transcriptional regulator [Sorangiineae bacterium]|nr:sigma 54-interacting transcriptional regulator [Polyangiaceae bacterium]MEB2323454.1 sigma 54-interacting transcriptional regulator [Sorangiineae bacterium]